MGQGARPDPKGSLDDHVVRHGKDFGVSDPVAYGEMANSFFNNSNVPNIERIIAKDGVIRIYDPKTNTFGSYNPDGTTRTFYKPKQGQAYWDNQKKKYGE